MARPIDPNSARQAREARHKELNAPSPGTRRFRLDQLTDRITAELLRANPHIADAERKKLVRHTVQLVVNFLVPSDSFKIGLLGDSALPSLIEDFEVSPWCDGSNLPSEEFIAEFDKLFGLPHPEPLP